MVTTRPFDRIVLAHSGSLSSAVAIPWLAERYAAEIVTVTIDLDQRRGLEAIRDRALASGAIRAHVVDASEEFARDFIVPALRSGAISADVGLTLPALTQAVIARHLVQIAHLEDTTVVAHGFEQARANAFEDLVRELDPALVVLAPVANWTLSAAELSDYARTHRIPLGATESGGVVRMPNRQPDCPAYPEVAFEQGMPVALNGVSLPLVELLASLDTIAVAHGVRPEAPAVALLFEAHRALQSQHFHPDQADVTGTARLRLFKGHTEVVECRSPFVQPPLDAQLTTEIVTARS
jgi:argininosuccinate synthase